MLAWSPVGWRLGAPLSQLMFLRVVVRRRLSFPFRVIYKRYPVALETQTRRILPLRLAVAWFVARRRWERILLFISGNIVGHRPARCLFDVALLFTLNETASNFVVSGRHKFLSPHFIVDVSLPLALNDVLNAWLVQLTSVRHCIALNTKGLVPLQSELNIVFNRNC